MSASRRAEGQRKQVLNPRRTRSGPGSFRRKGQWPRKVHVFVRPGPPCLISARHGRRGQAWPRPVPRRPAAPHRVRLGPVKGAGRVGAGC